MPPAVDFIENSIPLFKTKKQNKEKSVTRTGPHLHLSA
jgi:hypothetical protein